MRQRAFWAAVGAVALVAAPILFNAAPTAAAGPQASVGTETEFWNAWIDPDVTQIDLTASLQLHSGDGNGTCSPNTYPERDADEDTLVDGHGFTLTMNCSQNAVLYQFSTSGTPSLTVQNITLTHAGAPTPTATGNGVVNEGGGVIVHNSTITGNWVSDTTCALGGELSAQFLCVPGGGGIAANGDVWIDNSTVSNNLAPVGGGIYSSGMTTAVNTRIAGNLALTTTDVTAGGGIFAEKGAELTNVEMTQNFAGCEAECFAYGGGVGAFGPTSATGSWFQDNAVGCEAECGNYGGGLFVLGALAIDQSQLIENRAACDNECAADGGGFFATGEDFTETDVRGPFGGVHASAAPAPGTVTVTDSLFRANEATTTDDPGGECDCSGGGFYVTAQPSVTVTGSTFSENLALYAGGAFLVYHDVPDVGEVTVVDSTVTGNSSSEAGAIATGDEMTLTLVYDTITDNEVIPAPDLEPVESTFFDSRAQGGVRGAASEPASVSAWILVVFGTVISGPVGGPNCFTAGPAMTQGWNYSDDTSCGFTDTANGDNQAPGNNPLLGALGDHGGPTPTQPPSRSSPLVNAIPVGSCQAGAAAGVTVDQRGIARPQGAGCDIGSVEVPPPSPAFTG